MKFPHVVYEKLAPPYPVDFENEIYEVNFFNKKIRTKVAEIAAIIEYILECNLFNIDPSKDLGKMNWNEIKNSLKENDENIYNLIFSNK